MDGDGYGHSYDDEHPWHEQGDDGGDDRGGGSRKRRRKNLRRRPANLSPPPSVLDLNVTGTGCRLYHDDSLAERLDKGCHLINYFEDRMLLSDDDSDDDSGCCIVDGEETGGGGGGGVRKKSTSRKEGDSGRTLLIDRYDARTLLDDFLSMRKQRTKEQGARVDIEKRERLLQTINAADTADGLNELQIDDINFERFGALPEYKQIFVGESESKYGPSASGKMSANDEGTQDASDDNAEEPFNLTDEEVRFLPVDMVTPSTKRQNGIIQLTAQRAIEASQFEVLLKVKQKANPDFAFLLPEHKLHPYYVWLKGQGGSIVRPTKEEKSCSFSSDDESASGLGLLEMYSSSDDDEDGINAGKAAANDSSSTDTNNKCAPDVAIADKGTCSKMSVSAEPAVGTSEQIDDAGETIEERRAKRLKKAQELKAHFTSKLGKGVHSM